MKPLDVRIRSGGDNAVPSDSGDWASDLLEGRPLPVTDETSDFIWCDGLVERHEVQWDAPAVLETHERMSGCRLALQEFRRILRPGGVLRISTVDLEAVARRYARELTVAGGLPDGTGSRGEAINAAIHGGGRVYLFDEESLASLLYDNGFLHVERRGPGQSRHTRLRDLQTSCAEALVLECVRPPFGMVHAIGDSHAHLFERRPGFMFHPLGDENATPTAYNIGNPDGVHDWPSKCDVVLEKVDFANDLVVLSAGEVDCRIHINDRRIDRGDQSPAAAIDKTVDRYCEFRQELRSRGANVLVLGIPPAGRQEDNRFGAVHYASREERSKIFKMFNARLEARCQGLGLRYIDMYSPTVDGAGLISKKYAEDNDFRRHWARHETHLNRRAFRFVLEYLEREYPCGR